ncbi:MAG: hypothetical protein IPM47_02330 [Sphingobacteriales bacterium]|nr:MAG: hypothetical protein IPM47_02330 [Sphingobacteriales bacterium]
MNQVITQNDLVRYAYNETTPEENMLIRQAIENDLELSEMYHEMLIGQTMLDLMDLASPSESSISIILGYNRLLEELQPTC